MESYPPHIVRSGETQNLLKSKTKLCGICPQNISDKASIELKNHRYKG